MKYLLALVSVTAFAQQAPQVPVFSEKVTVKCNLLDKDMKTTNQSIIIENDYHHILNLEEFSHKKGKFYRRIPHGGYTQTLKIEGDGLKKKLAQAGVKEYSEYKSSIGFTTDGTPYPAGVNLNLVDDGSVVLTGAADLEPRNDFKKFEAPWQSIFWREKTVNDLRYDSYKEQGISNLRIYGDGHNLDIKMHCYTDLNNTRINIAKWESVGASIPQVGYGERALSPDNSVFIGEENKDSSPASSVNVSVGSSSGSSGAGQN